MAIDPISKITVAASVSLFLLLNAFSLNALGFDSSNSVSPPDGSVYFTKVYLDGFSINSNGFKLILRPYERHQEIHFQLFLADIEYVLMTQGQVIYSKIKWYFYITAPL